MSIYALSDSCKITVNSIVPAVMFADCRKRKNYCLLKNEPPIAYSISVELSLFKEIIKHRVIIE